MLRCTFLLIDRTRSSVCDVGAPASSVSESSRTRATPRLVATLATLPPKLVRAPAPAPPPGRAAKPAPLLRWLPPGLAGARAG
jgi:hypothetical protein